MTTVNCFAALEPGAPLQPFAYELGALPPEHIDIDVLYCGICHSDLSMIGNDWEISRYPLVPGHEVIGRIAAVGERVRHLTPGQTVGVGWYSQSCMVCRECLDGDHNLCASVEGVIVGRHGGFADRVRVQAAWAVPLPPGLDPATAGPMFCGGITVFNPIVQNDIRPTDRVGVVGIGGLGHLALKLLKAWGCEVTAFSTNPEKAADARAFGADAVVGTRDADGIAALAGSFDMILVTINQPLDWDVYIQALRPRGRLHIVGAAPSVTAAVAPLLLGQKSIGGSPSGSPATMARLLGFAARHGIEPVTEIMPLSRVNDALDHLRSGKARYRVVLRNDLA